MTGCLPSSLPAFLESVMPYLGRPPLDSEGGPIRDLDNVYRPLSVLMRTTMETIASERTVLEAAQTMAEKRIGSLLVIEAGEMVS